jgi:hypothetical protein
MTEKTIAYPELRALMAKYGVTIIMLAAVIKRSIANTSHKINKQLPFSIIEMSAIRDYFQELENKSSSGRVLTINDIFSV